MEILLRHFPAVVKLIKSWRLKVKVGANPLVAGQLPLSVALCWPQSSF